MIAVWRKWSPHTQHQNHWEQRNSFLLDTRIFHHVCACIYIYGCVICMYLCMLQYLCVYICVYVSISCMLYVTICMCIYVCLLYVCVHLCMFIYVCIYIMCIYIIIKTVIFRFCGCLWTLKAYKWACRTGKDEVQSKLCCSCQDN